tara:strand:+ start:886 stop:1329 length:444 start_codon:yes stop_codon:yes gene_type:complete
LKKNFKSVGAIIFYKGKYLIQKRDNKKNIFFPNFWGVFGGGLKKNEDAKKAILRELKEELNLTFEKPIKKLSLKVSSKNFKPVRHRIFFICHLKTLPKKIKIYEGKDFALLPFYKIKKLNFIPWDFSAISYHYYDVVKNLQILPKKQ